MAPFSPLSSDQMEAFCDLLVGARNLIWPDYSEVAIEFNFRSGHWMTWSGIIPILVQVNTFDTQERRMPDVEQRLRTAFVLCQGSSDEAEEVAAAEAYIATMNPSVGDSFNMTSEIAVAAAAGFKEVTNAPYIPCNFSKNYCEVVQTSEYGKTLSFGKKFVLPPPKPKGGKPPPKGGKPGLMKLGYVRTRFRLPLIGKLIEIRIIDELLHIWEGNYLSYIQQSLREASVGISAPLKAEVKLARRGLQYTNTLSAEKLYEILDKTENPNFWNWFHNIALKGMIKGDPSNCGRTGWFLKKAEHVGGGVRLKRRWKIKEIQEFLGPATWTNSTRDRMKFQETVDAFLLCGSVVVSGNKRYLELEWQEEGTCDASGTGDKVPVNLKIGSS